MPSIYFKKWLQGISRKIDKDLQIRWVFTCNNIKKNVSNKDRIPKALKSCVVYRFACEVDPRTTYIGRTLRHMNARMKEYSVYKCRLSLTID